MSSLEVVGIVIGAIVAASVGFVALLPWLIGPIVRVVLSVRYGFRVRGRENFPRTGPVVVVANHVTWIDGLFLAATAPRRGHILANADFFRNPLLRFLAGRAGMIPVPFTGPKAQRAAIVAARAAIDRGDAFAICPEGQLTRNGLLGPFYRGVEVILKGHGSVPVVPASLDGLWGSVWSFEGGRTFGRWPRGLRRTIRVAFGPPLTGPPSLFQIRLGLLEAGVDAFELRRGEARPLETLDPSLPSLDHPTLGPLTASAPDFSRDGVVQPGVREGTVGLPRPGVALRAVGDDGLPLPEDVVGRLQARVAGRPGWSETGLSGRLDRDGFLTLFEKGAADPGGPAARRVDGPGTG